MTSRPSNIGTERDAEFLARGMKGVRWFLFFVCVCYFYLVCTPSLYVIDFVAAVTSLDMGELSNIGIIRTRQDGGGGGSVLRDLRVLDTLYAAPRVLLLISRTEVFTTSHVQYQLPPYSSCTRGVKRKRRTLRRRRYVYSTSLTSANENFLGFLLDVYVSAGHGRLSGLGLHCATIALSTVARMNSVSSSCEVHLCSAQ